MSKEHVIFVSTVWEWGPGDGSIVQGIYQLLPELKNYDIHFSTYYLDNHDKTKNDPAKYEELLRTAKYVIVPGTPSWPTPVHRITWELCAKHHKHIAFLGIGLTIPYEADFWYGREEWASLAATKLIDLIVCRDKYCYYWLGRRCGFDSSKITELPCPAFYIFPTREVTEKKNVVYSIADVDAVACSTPNTLKHYYDRTEIILANLKQLGANVSICLNAMIDERHPFYLMFQKRFAGNELHRFNNPQDYIDFHKDKHIYIGVRNHGALPCAGAGIPGLLLGTDYRQMLAQEIPFLSRLDISYTDWKAQWVLDWYQSVEPASISKSLVRWRELTYLRWREALKPVIEALS